MDNPDVLGGFSHKIKHPESSANMELFEMRLDEIQYDLKKTNKKLKQAQKKIKKYDKLKKKHRKLKKKNKKNKQFRGGRWDGLVEKSVPKLIDLATLAVDRKMSKK
jgi:hypothetical protein